MSAFCKSPTPETIVYQGFKFKPFVAMDAFGGMHCAKEPHLIIPEVLQRPVKLILLSFQPRSLPTMVSVRSFVATEGGKVLVQIVPSTRPESFELAQKRFNLIAS
eukprot:2428033-Amphidinium_carterae.1